MYEPLEHDLKNLDSLLSLVKNRSIEYLNKLSSQPTNKPKPELRTETLNQEGLGLEAALEQFYEFHNNKLVSSSGPRYWGFVTGGTTPAAIAGDWLTSVFDQSPQGLTGPGGATAVVEREAIDLLLDLFRLPKSFYGGFVTGATMANFTGLAVARQWAGLKNNNDIAREGIKTDIKIFAATPHSSAVKTLSLLGLGSTNIVLIKTLPGNREAIDTTDLEDKLKTHQDFPIILISSGGTVNTVDFDDMDAIAQLHERYSFFWHVDAAFGGFAACSEKYRHLLKGWELADSIAVDCHKWMNVPYDSAVCFVNKKYGGLQVQTFQHSNAPYLGNLEDNFSYLNVVPESSRRFRALPAWLSLKAYGSNGFSWIVENNVSLAKTLGERLENETIFRLAAPVRLNVVCFTTKQEDKRSETVSQTLDMLNKNGKVFLTPTIYKGVACLRAALVNWRTTRQDIDIAIEELRNSTRTL